MTEPTARRARRIAIFLLILAAQFLLFEMGLRTWGSSEAAPAFQGLFIEDPVIGFRLKPNARVRFTTPEFDTNIAVNAAGLRDSEELGPKPPNEKRIVILGDSIVLSVQVPFEQTFGELLEARLNQAGGPHRYRVINAGIQGFGPVHELQYFKRIAAEVAPDVVLTSLFVGNDAEDSYSTRAALSGAPPPALQQTTERLVVRLRRLVRRSMVLQILRVRVLSATERLTPTLAPPEPPLQSYAAQPAPRIQEGIAITRDAVKAIAEHASAMGARTGIMLVPARFQVDDGDYERLKTIVQQSGGELVRDAATARFEAALQELPYPLVDVLPAMRRALPGPDLWFQRTVHLTPRGHVVVAETLERFLRTSGLLEDLPPPAAR